MRILIVEDNVTFASLVADQLAQSGFNSDCANSVMEAKHAISMMDYSAILLDLGLPDQDGTELLRDLRSCANSTPVLIVSARGGLRDRVKGLHDGADDYLTKPFSMDELVARLHALLRRPRQRLGKILSAGNVSLDVENRQLSIESTVRLFPSRALDILELLLVRKGNAVPRRIFEHHLFGLDGEQDINTLDVHIHRIRRQLVDAGATVEIHTIRGVGYMMTEATRSKDDSFEHTA